MRKMGKGKISFFEIAAFAFVSALFLIFSKDRGETALFLIFSLAVIYGLRGRIPAEGAAGKKGCGYSFGGACGLIGSVSCHM